jgi:signal transduction histidine kinase
VHLHHEIIIEVGSGGSITIGPNTHIQPLCQYSAYKAAIHIGRDVQIAPFCAFYPYDHGFAPDQLIMKQPLQTRGDIVIGDDAWLEAHEETDEAAALWREVGPQSLLIVPLRVGDRSVGALKLIATAPGRRFGVDVMDLALRLATHASFALETARLYRSARQATRAREQMLGVVSHDLRNPLSAIAMCAKVLRDAPPEDEQERLALLGTIGDSTEWMNRLIQDLLDVAAIEAGRLSLARQSERPRSMITAALQMFEVEAAERSVELRADAPADLPTVLVDEGRVVQLLGNLLRNALKFSPDGSSITVAAVARDREVVFSVRDQGPGIAPEDEARVFERYWRTAAGARHRGAGLGLSIARGIVEAHGGRMWLESALGDGSTFYFSLPVG